MIDHKRKHPNYRKPTYQPWDYSHAPKNFERTDKTGRHTPITEREPFTLADKIAATLIGVCVIVWVWILYHIFFGW
jgi:hypothetical protein